jgi:hypothetical protein
MSDGEDNQEYQQQQEEEQEYQPQASDEKEAPKQQQQQQEDNNNDDMSNALTVDEAWKTISKDNAPFNWYLVTVNKAQTGLEYVTRGKGGLKEMKQYLKDKSSEIYFGILRVTSNDMGGSKRAKFIYIRFVGSTVPVMKKAKITPQLGKYGDNFPVKHLTLDLNDDLIGFDVDALSREFLRVGGAHKPDSYEYGPNQVFNVK